MSGPPAAPEAPDAAFRRVALVALIALVAFTYQTNLDGPFVFDDKVALVDNEALHPLDAEALFFWLPTRFIGMLSFALNWSLVDGEPLGLRVVNVGIHALNACLVLALLLSTLGRALPKVAAGRRQAAAMIGASVFAAHPLQTQAVVYIWQRVASLAATFYLGALVLVLAALRRSAQGRPWALHWGAALALGVLGMFTKQNTVTLPIAALVLVVTLYGRGALRDLGVKALVPWGGLLAVIPLTMLLAGDMAVADMQTAPEGARGPIGYLLTQAEVILLYFRLVIWPSGQSLIHDVPTGALTSPATLAFGLFHLCAIGLAGAAWWRRRSLLGTAVLLIYVTLSVESSVLPLIDEAFEHRMYLPMAGVALGLAVLVTRLPLQLPRGVAAPVLIGLFVALPLSSLSLRRLAIWHDPMALWEEAARVSPHGYHSQFSYAVLLRNAGRLEEAVPHFRAAARARPHFAVARTELGVVLCSVGRCEEGLPELKAAYALRPTDAVEHQFLTALAQLGRFDEAVAVMDQRPPTGPLRSALYAKLLLDAGRPADALAHLKKVIAAAPPGAERTPEMYALRDLELEAQKKLSADSPTTGSEPSPLP